MTNELKSQLQSSGKTLGVIGLAALAVGVATKLALSPAPVKTATLLWDYPAQDLPEMIFVIVSKTELGSPWKFYTNVVGTNRLTIPQRQSQEFFTISKVMWSANTNAQAIQRGFE
jgi:hypothetical protein